MRDNEDKGYYIVDGSGNRLNNIRYATIGILSGGYEVCSGKGLNVWGYVDGQGKEVLPMAYGDILHFSDKWQMGVVLEEATVDNYDYKGGDSFYLVTRYDVFFEGKKVSELSRTAYNYAYPRGDYLYIKDREGVYSYYNKDMVKSSYTGENSSEYFEDYKTKTVWHCGSGQVAFVPGCTLTRDEVEEYMFKKGNIMYDLQGNELFDVSEYDNVYRYYGDYAKVKKDGKCGLIDRAGMLVVPCEYDDIPAYFDYFVDGYQSVIKDGKAGFVNKNGEVTCDFKYAASNIKNFYPPVASLKDMEGNTIVLSGAAGELEEKYAEVRLSYKLIAAKKADGTAGVIDWYGNVVIPFDGKYDDVYDFMISKDETLVVGKESSYIHHVYTLKETEEEEALPESGKEMSLKDYLSGLVGGKNAGEEAAENKAVSNADAWDCACGAKNTGKFCAECGSAKPEKKADGSWVCECGSLNDRNFCPECGAARPVEPEKLKCKSCGFEPEEGSQPKFCMECGTAF